MRPLGARGIRARCALLCIWTGRARSRARCTVLPQAATTGDGTRGTRPSPHPGGLYADAAAARHAISLLSARHIDGQWSLDQKALGRTAATGARGSARHDSARSVGTQGVGQHGADPGGTICRFMIFPRCVWTSYIDAPRSNARTLSAPLWRMDRLQGFRTESVNQAIATSRGGEAERIRRRQRTRSASRMGNIRHLRPRRGCEGAFGRAQRDFAERAAGGCASLFRLYAQRRELNHQPPIPTRFTV